ncbi:Chromosomal replication initiator protein DnaA [Beijerinckiaceae bacterium RH AL1]|nr:chromosomal replication initiator protein DnaA [Beijerinckiaceae bacterium]VVB42067.1 Chromosomal replication initiator protein DnaA [Beijerinckiaceae bacterium RH CH11]VVB42068.1 Chromosomal replication initiator protein DnaA [Beijerinckiaceae bacterium RH AL8]VVC53121.1 Chromosomal replication initiator protein DnaA [Beijerinckiaceae bacterium RH AL1]
MAVSAKTDDVWDRICRRLRAELGEDVFSSWFGRLELDAIVGDVAQLSVPTKFLKSWIQSHYLDRMLAVIASEVADVKALSIVVRSSSRPAVGRPLAFQGQLGRPDGVPQQAPVLGASAAPFNAAQGGTNARPQPRDGADVDSLGGSPLDKRMTLDTFHVGRSNQLAHSAAQRVATAAPGETLHYNPLYIHASVGLGKTHLLQAVAHAVTASKRRVIYLTAEKFMYGFVMALKAQTSLAFKERLRGIDVLIIDDVQFLQGKSIQAEFCHTINALIDAQKQIVIAADRPPADLESLEERVRSRLSGGLAVEIGALDEALRVRMLESRIAAVRCNVPTFDVSAAVIAYVASVIQTNGRDLDGAVNRLMAHASLTHSTLTVETAEVAIRDLVRTREPKRVKIEDIQKLVATHYNVSRADILSSRRTANVVRPRQIAMYLSKVLTLRSLPEIGRRFGGRDHTTVLHAVRKIEGLTGSDRTLQDEVELLKRMLLD